VNTTMMKKNDVKEKKRILSKTTRRKMTVFQINSNSEYNKDVKKKEEQKE